MEMERRGRRITTKKEERELRVESGSRN